MSNCRTSVQFVIAWGHNLTILEGEVNRTTADGGTTIDYKVNDDLPPCYLLTIGSIIVAVVVIAIVIMAVVMYRRKGRTASIEDD